MPNYNQAHSFYAGVDRHTRSMFVHIQSAKESSVSFGVAQHPCPKRKRGLRHRKRISEVHCPDLVKLFGAASFSKRDTAKRTMPAHAENSGSTHNGFAYPQSHRAGISRRRARTRSFFFKFGGT